METAAVIRRAMPADIPALIALLELLFSIEKDFVFNAAKQEQGLKMLLESSSSAIVIAAQAKQVIGMCTGQLLVSTAEGGPAVMVEDVAVLPSWQGKGIGGRLIDAITAWARSQGASRMQLLADRNNAAALAFYRKTGFKSTELICLRKMIGEK